MRVEFDDSAMLKNAQEQLKEAGFCDENSIYGGAVYKAAIELIETAFNAQANYVDIGAFLVMSDFPGEKVVEYLRSAYSKAAVVMDKFASQNHSGYSAVLVRTLFFRLYGYGDLSKGDSK